MTFITGLAIGFFAGGITCALSVKVYAWFQKKAKAVENKTP